MEITTAVYTSPETAALSATSFQRTIVCRFRNPSRTVCVNVSSMVWTEMEAAVRNVTYKAILDSALTEAAKAIISQWANQYLVAGGVIPSEMPVSIVSAEAILDMAASSGSDWPSKEELTEQWKASATRAKIYSPEKYASNKQYRIAYTRFEELIIKFAGKTSQFEEKDLDVILTKLAESDYETGFGRFILKRIEAIKNKPQKETISMDDLL